MSHRWLIAVSGIAHLAVAGGLFVTGVWHMERLHADPVHDAITLSPPPPPAPPGGPKSAVTSDVHPKDTKVIAKVPVQPQTKPAEPPAPDTGDPPGGGNGSGTPDSIGTCTENCGPAEAAAPVCGNGSVEAGEQCDDGNTTNGDGCSSTCQREPKPEPPRTSFVAPNVLRGLRISGETQIHPSATTQTLMIREGKSHVEAVLKVCLGTDGSVASVDLRTPTGYDEYDQALRSAVRSWRYQPYLLNGAAVPACSYVNFTYTIR